MENPLANTNVTFTINGIIYTYVKIIQTFKLASRSNEECAAKLNINLRPGSYTLTTYNLFTGEQQEFKVKILPIETQS